MKRSSSKKITTRQRRGAAVVELAVTLPIFLVIIIGMIEVGRGIMVAQILTSAARLGARQSIVENATNASVESAVVKFCEDTIDVAGDSVSVSISINGMNGGGDISASQRGDICTVSVSVPFNEVSYITPHYLADQQIVGTCSMERE